MSKRTGKKLIVAGGVLMALLLLSGLVYAGYTYQQSRDSEKQDVAKKRVDAAIKESYLSVKNPTEYQKDYLDAALNKTDGNARQIYIDAINNKLENLPETINKSASETSLYSDFSLVALAAKQYDDALFAQEKANQLLAAQNLPADYYALSEIYRLKGDKQNQMKFLQEYANSIPEGDTVRTTVEHEIKVLRDGV